MAYHGNEPARGVLKVTKSDSTTYNARGFLVGTAGTINITDGNGVDKTDFPAVAGVVYPIVVTKVRTGGTADDIWILS